MNRLLYQELVARALAEDLGRGGDLPPIWFSRPATPVPRNFGLESRGCWLVWNPQSKPSASSPTAWQSTVHCPMGQSCSRNRDCADHWTNPGTADGEKEPP